MSEHAQPQQQEEKKHGDELANAVNTTKTQGNGQKDGPAPSTGKKE